MAHRTVSLAGAVAVALAVLLSLGAAGGCAKGKRDRAAATKRQRSEVRTEVATNQEAQTDGAAGDAASDPRSRAVGDGQPAGPLTGEAAKQALVALVRATPGEWIGNPDPDKLAEVPLTNYRQGRYGLGAFLIDTESATYQAWIGQGQPVSYQYEGRFAQSEGGGGWEALPPEMRRVWDYPDPAKTGDTAGDAAGE